METENSTYYLELTIVSKATVLMLIAGVDDAGRGAVVGPLVIAGVLLREDDLPRLKQIGAKDSKLLSPNRRQVLASEIRKIAQKHSVLKLQPREIDAVVTRGKKLHKLNWLEAQAMATVIEALGPDRVYVDASDVLEERFKQQILECLRSHVEIVSEHKADRNFVVVAAASIIAKVERDREIALLSDVYGDFGSGYPSDSKTMSFLERLMKDTGNYPEFIRKSWKPAKKVKERNSSNQSKLI